MNTAILSLAHLVGVVVLDDNCQYPSAERLLRHLMGDPWDVSKCGKRKRYVKVKALRINDPEGLIHSIRSSRYGSQCEGNGHRGKRQPRIYR